MRKAHASTDPGNDAGPTRITCSRGVDLDACPGGGGVSGTAPRLVRAAGEEE